MCREVVVLMLMMLRLITSRSPLVDPIVVTVPQQEDLSVVLNPYFTAQEVRRHVFFF